MSYGFPFLEKNFLKMPHCSSLIQLVLFIKRILVFTALWKKPFKDIQLGNVENTAKQHFLFFPKTFSSVHLNKISPRFNSPAEEAF